jgi:hypothetical protein
MRKIPIEEVIEQTKLEPFDKSTAAWCQLLNKHRNATHQQLLDALNNAVAFALLWTDEDHPVVRNSKAAIEAASFVEVEE